MTDRDNKRAVIASVVDRDPVGRHLTPEARKEAIDIGVAAWKGDAGNGDAARAGIKHVVSRVLKDET